MSEWANEWKTDTETTNRVSSPSNSCIYIKHSLYVTLRLTSTSILEQIDRFPTFVQIRRILSPDVYKTNGPSSDRDVIVPLALEAFFANGPKRHDSLFGGVNVFNRRNSLAVSSWGKCGYKLYWPGHEWPFGAVYERKKANGAILLCELQCKRLPWSNCRCTR
jgi:hypothetical protein